MKQGAAVSGKGKGNRTRPDAAPTRAPESPSPAGEGREDPYDALTALFLGPEDAESRPREAPQPLSDAPASVKPAPPGQPGASAAILVEGLILGHVPVLAPAWAAQYARRTAEGASHPLAFMRIQAGTLSIDLIGPSGRRVAGSIDAGAGAQQAIEHATSLTGRWIVRVDEADEPRLMHDPGIDLVTLLTGADEAAIVAAYRTLKRLSLANGHDGRVAANRLRVVMVGAPAERARLAAERLAGATAAFLGRSIELGHYIERIESGPPPISLSRVKTELRPPALLDLIHKAPPPPAPPPSRPHQQTPAEPPFATPAFPEALGPLPTPVADAATESLPAAAAEPKPAQVEDPSLARHITSLTALPARCPFAKEVELAIDVVGRAHVLVRALDDEPDAAVRDALIAAAWLTEHAELVGLTAPRGLKLETARPPVRHVFIQQSKSASGMLRTGMRVHLVSRAENGRETSIELE